MRSIAVLFALAASAFAFSVTEPTNSTGWTTSGPNQVSWTKVDTDAANFTIVLVNQAHFPPTKQVLDALVDASLGKIVVNPPSGGWKTGSGFQVNLVKDAENTDAILAQSEQFTISTSTSSTFSTATSGSVSASAASGPSLLHLPRAVRAALLAPRPAAATLSTPPAPTPLPPLTRTAPLP
ncbi:hypothetical protein C8Q77DRAFT_401032 [Trametes polyzona]|nr:hypothetical protein C8Q77DRAFT_401032 [Trametes polyzona]